MNDDPKTADPAASEAPPDPQPEAQAKANPQPSWEYRKNFKVVDKMVNIVNLTIDVSKSEITRLRRQIDKLTYGS